MTDNTIPHTDMPEGFAAFYWTERDGWAVMPKSDVTTYEGKINLIPAGHVFCVAYDEDDARAVAKAVNAHQRIIDLGAELGAQQAWPEDYDPGAADLTQAELLAIVQDDPEILIGLATLARHLLMERRRS